MSIHWLQLSDFHIGKERYAQQNICKEIIEHVKKRVQEDAYPLDFIFITGDLANKGKAKEFESFYEDFFAKLVDVINLDFDRIFMIPGNHDIDIESAKAVVKHGVFNQIPEFFDPTEEGLKQRKLLLDRFSEYIKSDIFSPKVNEKHWLESVKGADIRQFESINNHKVGIIGLNTAWLHDEEQIIKNNDLNKGNMTPGKAIVASALDEIKDSSIKIILGHHPLLWWVNEYTSNEHCKEIKSLFAQNKAIYLHGHLHYREEHYENDFLSIGAGACFASRDAKELKIWKNGLLWGKFDTNENGVEIEALTNKSKDEWVFDSLAFAKKFLELEKSRFFFPIPTPIVREKKHGTPKLPPTGWRKIDKNFLNEKRGGSNDLEIINFLDGALPTWGNMLSGKIPVRNLAKQITKEIDEAGDKNNDTCLRIILGAGGEGKTTILYQTIIELLSHGNNWNILWHESIVEGADDINWPCKYFENLPKDEKWLIVSDYADAIAKGLEKTLEELKDGQQGNIHFLISSRTSDWMTARANEILWDFLTNDYKKIPLYLKPEEAKIFLFIWKQFGRWEEFEGLNDKEAVEKFQKAAVAETKSNPEQNDEGTLLGAMLSLRYGKRLRAHVYRLLQKLDKVFISDEKTLLDAFALISIPHDKGIKILSKYVLAKALDIKTDDLYSKILIKLADEASIFTPSLSGKYQEKILTRHQSIAKTVVDILETEFHYDITEKVYVLLIKSARKLMLDGFRDPYQKEWNNLPRSLSQQGNLELAVRLITAQQEIDPESPILVTELGKILRDANKIDQAIDEFRDSLETVKRDRIFYAEWGTCEGIYGNDDLGVWLTSISLADKTEKGIPSYRTTDLSDVTIRAGMNNLSLNFKQLSSLNDKDSEIFIEAMGAVVVLGLEVKQLDKETEESLLSNLKSYKSIKNNEPDKNIQNAINTLYKGIRTASQRVETSNLPEWLKPAEELSFNGLEKYFGIRK